MTFDELASQPGAKIVGDAPSFDELAAHPDAKVVDGPDTLEAGARGLAQGATFGFGDEIAGGAEAIWDKLKGSNSPFAEAYRKHRDESRANFKAAEEADPTAFGAGQIAGGVGTGLLAAPLTGGASLGSAIALGAGGGALNALGESSELDAQAAEDVLKGGAMGGAFGAAGHGVGKLVGSGVNALTSKVAPAIADKLDDVALASANRAIRGGSTGTKNALSPEQLTRALEEGIVGYGDDIESIAAKAAAGRAQAGGHLESLEDSLAGQGVQTPELTALAQKWLAKADEIEKSSLGSPLPALYRDRANELLTKGKSAFEGEWPAGDWTRRAPLKDSIEFKRSLQNAANYDQNAPRVLEEGRRDLAGDMKDAVIGSLDESAAANPELAPMVSDYKDANTRAGDLIGVSNAANKGLSLTENRSAMGPTAKIIGLGGLATGNFGAAAVAGAKHLYDTRGQATLAKAAFDMSKSLGKLGQVALTDPAKLGKYGSIIASAAQRGPDALNSTVFVLGMSDPAFQKIAADLDGDGVPDDGAIR